uniref:hypothetical protein n=1 Tax=Burkholderia gladioli TaxID=28095 RepID=UPI0034DB3CAF
MDKDSKFEIGDDHFWSAVESAATSYISNISERTGAAFRDLSGSMRNVALGLGERAILAKLK